MESETWLLVKLVAMDCDNTFMDCNWEYSLLLLVLRTGRSEAMIQSA